MKEVEDNPPSRIRQIFCDFSPPRTRKQAKKSEGVFAHYQKVTKSDKNVSSEKCQMKWQKGEPASWKVINSHLQENGIRSKPLLEMTPFGLVRSEKRIQFEESEQISNLWKGDQRAYRAPFIFISILIPHSGSFTLA